ncbi:MAG: 5-(carboxyamino)imidazole ribonucleotide synthase [Anaerolineae bacterium]|nr:5-(carboxyamino)imidazole ribonucleotide synthase [Anaerolineae bacterium]
MTHSHFATNMTRLGILGGGQLAQMLTQAAISLGVETAIFEQFEDSPAARLTHHQVASKWDNEEALINFALMCQAVTLENEFVDSLVLRWLADSGLAVYPTADTLADIQDKLLQKQRIAAAGLAVPDFEAVYTPEDIREFGQAHGYPFLLKARRLGYDGYGNATIHSADDIIPAWNQLGADKGRELLAEAFIPFVRELAVMVLRGRDGELRSYPVVETIQQNHICHIVRAPAPISAKTAEKASELAKSAVEVFEGVGVFGAELFELADGTVLYNEIAPRPHNSGHYTIEACVTSQFENHIRAVLGWPLGSTAMVKPAAVMVNLLGQRQGKTNSDGIREALGVAQAHIHLYGKSDVRPGRKMGHVTALADTLAEAEAIAQKAADLVKL